MSDALIETRKDNQLIDIMANLHMLYDFAKKNNYDELRTFLALSINATNNYFKDLK